MSLFDVLRKWWCPPNPLETRIQEILATESHLDAVLVFNCVSPRPGFQSVTEWRCRGATCEQTWTHIMDHDCIDRGHNTLAATDALALIARLHEAVATKQYHHTFVKGGPTHAAAWKRGDQPIESVYVKGLIEPGPFKELLKDLQVHIPLWQRPDPGTPHGT